MSQQLVLDYNREVHLDNFAGGGGASEAYKMATRRDVDLAVNHNRPAVLMHRANHPHTRHFIEDVFAFDILTFIRNLARAVGSAWFSPDCKHFSKAKGGALIEKRIRALGWVMLKYVGIGGGRMADGGRGPACPRVLYMENVEEFVTWGPLVCKRDKATGRCMKTDGSVAAKGEVVPLKEQHLVPCLKRSGKYFRKLIRDFRARGATAVEWGTIVASDFGAPTIRKRLYMVVRFDGQPIVWPKPTHGDGPNLLPKRTAAECIDFSRPCPSVIFTTKEEAKRLKIQRPLVYNSNLRIAKGTERYVMNADRPFIVSLTHHGSKRVESVDQPFQTITAAHRGEKALVMPFVGYQQQGGATRPADAPLHTITASTKDQNQVYAAHVARQFKTTIGHPADEPAQTAMAGGGGGKSQVVATYLAKYHGAKNPDERARGQLPDEPLRTVDTENRFAQVQCQIAAAHIARDFGESIGSSADEPVGAVMPGGMGKTKVVASFLAQNNTGVIGHEAAEPMSTICARGTHQSLIACSLTKYYGTDQDPRLDEPLHTVTTKDRFGITNAEVVVPPLTPELADKARIVAAWLRSYGIEFKGEFATTKSGLVIYDIGMRMFEPRELFLAQGFPPTYVIDYGIDEHGNRVKLTKTQQIQMCGNSVSPPPAAALIEANNPEMLSWYQEEEAA